MCPRGVRVLSYLPVDSIQGEFFAMGKTSRPLLPGVGNPSRPAAYLRVIQSRESLSFEIQRATRHSHKFFLAGVTSGCGGRICEGGIPAYTELELKNLDKIVGIVEKGLGAALGIDSVLKKQRVGGRTRECVGKRARVQR